MPQEPSLLTLWSDSRPLSALIWAFLAIALLFLARRPVHDLIDVGGQALQRALKAAALQLGHYAERVAARNREVLLAVAEDHAERDIEREFRRLDEVIQRDLSGYPALHRQLSEQITRIDEDYRQSAEVPPMPPVWLDAVRAVAAIEAKGDPAVAKILEDIHATLQSASHNALLEYRASTRRRHLGLKRMLPYWRRLSATLGRVDKTMETVEERRQAIDARMSQYEALRGRDERMIDTLQASAVVRFLTAAFALAVAAGGAWLNYQLIAAPLNALVGTAGGTELLAATLVLLQVGAGLLLCELLGLTRMFITLSAVDDGQRRWFLRGALVALFGLALAQASLAFIGAGPAADPAAGGGWVPQLSHALLALVLPLTLSMVAVPLEACLQFGRISAGRAVTAGLRGSAALLRLLGVGIRGLGPILTRVYDLLVFLPLLLEEAHARRRGATAKAREAGGGERHAATTPTE